MHVCTHVILHLPFHKPYVVLLILPIRLKGKAWRRFGVLLTTVGASIFPNSMVPDSYYSYVIIHLDYTST